MGQGAILTVGFCLKSLELLGTELGLVNQSCIANPKQLGPKDGNDKTNIQIQRMVLVWYSVTHAGFVQSLQRGII